MPRNATCRTAIATLLAVINKKVQSKSVSLPLFSIHQRDLHEGMSIRGLKMMVKIPLRVNQEGGKMDCFAQYTYPNAHITQMTPLLSPTQLCLTLYFHTKKLTSSLFSHHHFLSWCCQLQRIRGELSSQMCSLSYLSQQIYESLLEGWTLLYFS